MTDRLGKIIPRNLTAQAAYLVPGNPTTSRPEDAPGNCFPGLELDVRNLDRRFFPGLVFDFVARNDLNAKLDIYGLGARLSYLDPLRDPALAEDWAQNLLKFLTGDGASELAQGIWFLEWIEQEGKRIWMYTDGNESGKLDNSLDGLIVWRIVRSLEADNKSLKIGLKRRDQRARVVELEGRRRTYTNPQTGVIDRAYQPGELMQSLCSPWQHDFQECLCHYWASNHPDIVFGEILPDERRLPDGAPLNPEQANTRIDWLRANRSRAMAAAALSTTPANRPFRMDHLEINSRWQELNVVIAGREIGARYDPPKFEYAEPLPSPADVAALIREVAPLEMALAIEYLYARFSLLSPDQALEIQTGRDLWPTLAEDVTFLRQQLMLIAVSEMQHLHWANQLLWEFYEARLIKNFEPVLCQAGKIPGADPKPRDHALRRLEPYVLQQFIGAEHPSGLIDGAYARVIATLRQAKTGEYPPHMIELVERIAIDGMHHESRLLHMQVRLATYAHVEPPYPYLRNLTPGTGQPAAGAACDEFAKIIASLRGAYTNFADPVRYAEHLAKARTGMSILLDLGEALAVEHQMGVPFWPWPPVSSPPMEPPECP